MLVVVSPAKNLDYQSQYPDFEHTEPRLSNKILPLAEHCKTLSPADLSSLMKISDKLSTLNADRFASFSPEYTSENSRAALFAFNGDVYTGLDAQSLSSEDIDFAQRHMRILSGLYGLLRPKDKMQPYRLEMGTKLSFDGNSNLYQYWDNTITDLLNEDIQEQGDNVLINLASNEYFSAVKKKNLDAMVITPHFKDEKNGAFKVISFYAKKARGLMARYIIQNKLTEVAQLHKFNLDGYYFDENESTATDLVFKRNEIKK